MNLKKKFLEESWTKLVTSQGVSPGIAGTAVDIGTLSEVAAKTNVNAEKNAKINRVVSQLSPFWGEPVVINADIKLLNSLLSALIPRHKCIIMPRKHA